MTTPLEKNLEAAETIANVFLSLAPTGFTDGLATIADALVNAHRLALAASLAVSYLEQIRTHPEHPPFTHARKARTAENLLTEALNIGQAAPATTASSRE